MRLDFGALVNVTLAIQAIRDYLRAIMQARMDIKEEGHFILRHLTSKEDSIRKPQREF